MSMRRHLAWMATSQAVFFLLQFGGSVVVARILGPAQMGVFAVAVAVIGVLSMVQTFGLTGFLVRQRELDDRIKASAFTLNLLINTALAAAIALCSTLGGMFLHEDGVRRVMLVLAVTPLVSSLEFLPFALLEREANFKAIALVNSAKTITTQGIAVWMALTGFGYMSMAYAQVCGVAVSAIGYNILGRQHVMFRFGLSEWRRIATFGLHMLAISGVNSLAARMIDLLVGRILGLSALGLYSRAASLNNILWDNVHIVIGRVLFSDFASYVRSGKPIRERYLATVEVLTAILWPAFAGVGILAGPIVLTLYGVKWLAAAPVLALMSLTSIVLVSVSLTWELFVMREETGRQARIEFIRASAGVVLFGTGCLTIGLVGAAGGRLAESIISAILYRSHVNRMTNTTNKDYFKIYGRSATLTVGSALPAYLIMMIHKYSEYTPIWEISLSVTAGIICWAGLLLLLKHRIISETTSLIKKILPEAC